MLEINGMTWTDSNETMQVYEDFCQKWGAEICKPCCSRCGRATCYIVEECSVSSRTDGKTSFKFLRTGLNLLLNHMPAGKFVVGDNVYIPITACHRCGARSDAEMRYTSGIKYPPDSSAWALTPTERQEYNVIYRLRVGDLEIFSAQRFSKA